MKKEPNTLREDVDALNMQPAELSEEELAQISGGWEYKEIEVVLSPSDEKSETE